MRSLSKSFIIIIIMCMFSFISGVNAETGKLSSVESDSVSAVVKLLGGSTLSGDDATKITSLMNKYTLYTKYEVIDDTLYNTYKSDTSNTEAGNSIANLIQDPASKSDLDDESNGWSMIESAGLSYSELEKDKGYLVALMAVSKSDATKIYKYKTVYQATTDSTLTPYSEVAKSNAEEDDATKKIEKENTAANTEESTDEETSEATAEEDVEKEEKSETNPETGISDYAIYIVPLSLVLGSTLMIKRRFV